MADRGEGAAHKVNQQSGSGSNPDCRHAGQDRMNRVSDQSRSTSFPNLIALDTQCGQLLRQARQYDIGCLDARDDYSLLIECLEDLCGLGLPHTRSHFDQPVSRLPLSQCSQLRGRGRRSSKSSICDW